MTRLSAVTLPVRICRIMAPTGPSEGSRVPRHSTPRARSRSSSSWSWVLFPEPSMPSRARNRPVVCPLIRKPRFFRFDHFSTISPGLQAAEPPRLFKIRKENGRKCKLSLVDFRAQLPYNLLQQHNRR